MISIHEIRESLWHHKYSFQLNELTSGNLTSNSSTRFGWFGKCFFVNVLKQVRYLSWITDKLGSSKSRIRQNDLLIDIQKKTSRIIFQTQPFLFWTIFLPSCETMAMTLRQTYSSILSWNCLNMAITLVIFSTIFPTSWRNWSIVIGFPIILVKHVCNVTKLVATWEK